MTHRDLRALAAWLRDIIFRHRILILVTLALIFAGSFAARNMTEVFRISRTVSQASPSWVIVALCIQFLVIGLAGLSYKVVMRTLGYRLPWPELAHLHLRRHVVGTITPIGGPASVYVFVHSLNARGVTKHDALFGAAIRGVTGYTSFVMLLIPVLLFGRPSDITLAGAVGLVLFLAALVLLMIVLLRESCSPTWLMSRLPPRVSELINQARTHRLGVRDLGAPFSLAIAHNALGVTTLYLCLLAVGERPALVVPLAGYAIGTLFMMVAPVFQGIGVVELTMALALQQLGIPAPAAIAATVLFRLSDLWFPLALGIGSHTLEGALSRRALVPVSGTALAAIAAVITTAILASLSGGIAWGNILSSVPASIFITVTVVSALWCVGLIYAVWTRRRLSAPIALSLLAVSATFFAVEGAEHLTLPFALLQVVRILVIG